ncbi:hypothetical protein BDR26DRAFT_852802 [Obelidium mucronatum]|nr:hypothetical protein BDR26DRAFT_852802 [Obelidium mucronatum]
MNAGFNLQQLTIVLIITGVIIEVSLTGLISTLSRWYNSASPNFWKSAILMILFNIGNMAYAVIYTRFTFFVNVSASCMVAGYALNAISHFVVVIFDCFLLFKMFHTVRLKKHKKMLYWVIGSILANRATWTVVDLFVSFPIWDSDNNVCYYIQNQITGIGYNLSDILCDVIVTLVSVVANWHFVGVDMSPLVRVLLIENMIRSVVVFTMNIVVMALVNNVQDEFSVAVVFLVQGYICKHLSSFVNSFIYFFFMPNYYFVFPQSRRAMPKSRTVCNRLSSK